VSKKYETKGGRYARNCQLARYVGVSDMTIWRWKRDPALNVPKSILINDKEYNDLQAWDDWFRSRSVSRVRDQVA
jgi:hypothetical protein